MEETCAKVKDNNIYPSQVAEETGDFSMKIISHSSIKIHSYNGKSLMNEETLPSTLKIKGCINTCCANVKCSTCEVVDNDNTDLGCDQSCHNNMEKFCVNIGNLEEGRFIDKDCVQHRLTETFTSGSETQATSDRLRPKEMLPGDRLEVEVAGDRPDVQSTADGSLEEELRGVSRPEWELVIVNDRLEDDARPDVQENDGRPENELADSRPNEELTNCRPDIQGAGLGTTTVQVVDSCIHDWMTCNSAELKTAAANPNMTSSFIDKPCLCDSKYDESSCVAIAMQDASTKSNALKCQLTDDTDDTVYVEAISVEVDITKNSGPSEEENEIAEAVSEELSTSEPPHDVEVAIINGPTSALDTKSEKIGLTLSLANTDSASSNYDDDSDDDDLSRFPDIIDVDHLPKHVVRPLYEVGLYMACKCEICHDHKYLYLRCCCMAPVCDTCMKTYLEMAINEGKVKIECPRICNQKYIHYDEIFGRISNEMREKYTKFLVDANNEPHIKTCPRCSSILRMALDEIQSPRVKKKGLEVTCSECELHWCFPCQAPWHEGITCKEYHKGNMLLKKWAKKVNMGQLNAQKCPRCKVFIQRVTGCDQMNCARCHTTFCYRCGERYLHLKFIGDHYSRFSILGCKNNLLPDNPFMRRLIRGSIFAAKLMCAPVALVLAAAIGPVIVGTLVFVLPCYGIYKCHKYWKDVRLTQRITEENARFEQRVKDFKTRGDPYMVQYNAFLQLGAHLQQVASASLQAQSQIRAPDNYRAGCFIQREEPREFPNFDPFIW